MTFSCFLPKIIMAYFVVDWDRNIFSIPYLNHPVSWYGALFAFSFLMGYFLVRKMMGDYIFKYSANREFAKKESLAFTDRLTIFIVIGAVVGARLGHVFFYEWSFYQKHPGEILKIWEGGLASHGGVLGIFIAILCFLKTSKKLYPFITFPLILDVLVIPGAFAASCIRFGNFINQEILGKPTELPWGVIFGHPVQKVGSQPLHPVQIYESLAYFLTFIFLIWLWKKRGKKIGDGILSASFFVIVFGFRFFVEFFKMSQSEGYDGTHFLNMGQILSLPFIVAGALFFLYHHFTKRV